MLRIHGRQYNPTFQKKASRVKVKKLFLEGGTKKPHPSMNLMERK